MRIEVISDSGQGHKGEPKRVHKGPDAFVPLGKVDQARHGENGNADEKEQQTELLVSLERKENKFYIF